MEVIGKENENHAMDVLKDEEINALLVIIRTFDRHLSIEKIDYTDGSITLGILHNEGTEHEFVDKEFLKVNVSMDSTGAELFDVIQNTFRRVM